MNALILIGAAQSFFFAVLLIIKKNKTMCDNVLAMWLGMLFIHLLDTYSKYFGIHEQYPHLMGITSSFVLIYGPLLYFYVDNYVSNLPGFKKYYAYHMVPFLAYNLYHIPYFFQSSTEKLLQYQNRRSLV